MTNNKGRKAWQAKRLVVFVVLSASRPNDGILEGKSHEGSGGGGGDHGTGLCDTLLRPNRAGVHTALQLFRHRRPVFGVSGRC